MLVSPKSVKPNKHDSHIRENPRTNSRRKQTTSKEKVSVSWYKSSEVPFSFYFYVSFCFFQDHILIVYCSFGILDHKQK